MLMEHPLNSQIICSSIQSNIIELVHPGDRFDNYTAFCSHLGIQAKTGNSKPAQETQIKRQIDYHVEGKRQIVIDAVLSHPKGKPMRASNSRLKDMDKLICHRLYNGKLNNYVTFSRLAIVLGLVNTAYSDIRYGDIIFQDDVPFDPHKDIYRNADAIFRLPEGRYKTLWRVLINSLAQKIHDSYRVSIKCTLKRLEQSGYIKLEEVALAKLHSGGTRLATYDDHMLDVERELATLKAIGCTNLHEVHRKNLFKKYQAEKKKHCLEHSDFEHLYSAVQITPGKPMDLSHFDAQTTYRQMSTLFLQNALKWKCVKSYQKTIFLLNRMLLQHPIWDYEMFELLWQTNMP